MSCQFCGAPEIAHEKTISSMTFQCETEIYTGLDARLRQSKRCLQVERQRIACALDRANTANIRARAMICDAAGIQHDADVLEWISGAKERIAKLEDSLTSIREYWNRDNNQRAMEDACWNAINTASEALDSKEAKP